MSNSDPGSLDMFAGSGSDLPLLSGSPAIAVHQEFAPVPPAPPAGLQLDLTDPPARYQVQPPDPDLAAAPAQTLAELLGEVQRLTRYQGRVELGTMWHNLSSPAHTGRPLAVFSRDDGTPLPFYAALHHYAALEAVGASWEEAVSAVIEQLRRLEAEG